MSDPAPVRARSLIARVGVALTRRDATPAPSRRATPITWAETLALAVVGGLTLWVMTQPAFRAFFLGEAFLYLGHFQRWEGDFARSLFSPADVIWFRPVFFGLSLPWYFILPLDPWFYHARNALFCIVNLVLLHRVLGHLVASRAPRVLAVLLFAISKVHLTTIGYINLYDSIIMLMLLLTTVLCLLRYIVHRRGYDLVFGLAACSLATWAKDQGAVILLVVLALVATHGLTWPPTRARALWWAARLAPLPLAALTYVGLRALVIAPQASASPVYAPGFSLNDVALKSYLLLSVLTNASLTRSSTAGAPGWGSLAASAFPALGSQAAWLDMLPLAGGLVLVLVTLIAARQRARIWLWLVVWIIIYLAPTFLIRNIQIYYTHESLAGLTLLIGLCLDRADRRLTASWGLAIMVFAIGGLVSNHASWYSWQRAADAARQVEERVLPSLQGLPMETLTFVAVEQSFWQWALTADEKGPMIPMLLGQPDLRVHVVTPRASPAILDRADPANPIVVIDQDFAIFPRR